MNAPVAVASPFSPDAFFSSEDIAALSSAKPALLVSGGPDSVFLFHVFLMLRRVHGVAFSVLHVDHGLRGAESDADTAFVRDLARSHDVPCRVFRAAFAPGGNLQARARNLRLAVCAEARARGEADVFFTAHHRDDALETLLMRRLRGASWRGLCGIRREAFLKAARGGVLRVIRPLLGISKDAIVSALDGNAIAFRTDSSNALPKYLRNRVRAFLSGAGKEWAEGEDGAGWLRAADDLKIADAAFAALAASEAARYRRFVPDEVWRTWSDELRFRVFARLAAAKGASGRDWEGHFARLQSGRTRLEMGEAVIFKDEGGLFFYSRSELEELSRPRPVPSCGSYFFGAFARRLSVRRVSFAEAERSGAFARKTGDGNVLAVDAAKVVFPLCLCAVGEFGTDSLKGTLLGRFGGGAVTLKDLFSERRVPAYARLFTPVLKDAAGNVVAVPGVEVSAAFAAREGREALLIASGFRARKAP